MIFFSHISSTKFLSCTGRRSIAEANASLIVEIRNQGGGYGSQVHYLNASRFLAGASIYKSVSGANAAAAAAAGKVGAGAAKGKRQKEKGRRSCEAFCCRGSGALHGEIADVGRGRAPHRGESHSGRDLLFMGG